MTASEDSKTAIFQQQVLGICDRLDQRVDRLSGDMEKFNDKFSNYQQAIQWRVQLSVTLMASAIATIIVTAVFKR